MFVIVTPQKKIESFFPELETPSQEFKKKKIMSLSRLSVSVSKTSKKKEQNNQFVGFKEEKHLFGHEKSQNYVQFYLFSKLLRHRDFLFKISEKEVSSTLH